MTPDDKSLPAILDKTDLAQLLKKSERTIERLHRARELPEPLTTGHPRWSRSAIERWLDGGTVSRRGRR